MCIICVCNERKLTDQEIANSWAANPHGAGIAIPLKREVEVAKGFMTEADFRTYYKQVHQLPHVVHFRLNSVGTVTPKLTHPFLCTPESPVTQEDGSPLLDFYTKDPVLFHNGHMPNWDSCLRNITGTETKGDWSDTRAIATMIAKMGEEILYIIGDKFVVTYPDRLRLFGTWYADNGNYYTNTTYKTRIYRYVPRVGIGGFKRHENTVDKAGSHSLASQQQESVHSRLDGTYK